MRYADDMAFLSPSREELEGLLRTVRAFMSQKLALSLNERKTGFKRTGDGIDFLGYFRCRVFEELGEVERFRGLGVEGLRK